MTSISIRPATPDDAEMIAGMLSRLADEIGDTERFSSTAETIRQHGFGKQPLFHCLVAGRETPDMGLALFFPIFSTTRAKPGVYVQDLWMAKDARGQGLGRRLLAEIVSYSAMQWDAAYLSLTVYASNTNATAFYQNIGFDEGHDDVAMALDGDAFDRLRGQL